MKLTDLVILLHTQSVSYCYYKSNSNVENWIPLDVLKGGIKYALKNNLFIQFVYPKCKLPENYKYIIESVKHLKIMPSCIEGQEDSIKVFSSLTEFTDYPFFAKNCILHIEFAQIEEAVNQIIKKGDFLERLNLIIDVYDAINTAFPEEFIGKVIASISSKISLFIAALPNLLKVILAIVVLAFALIAAIICYFGYHQQGFYIGYLRRGLFYWTFECGIIN